jgi:hypothetical protein
MFAEAVVAAPSTFRSCPVRRGKSLTHLSSLFAKIFWFTSDPNHLFIFGHPGPHRGAFRDRHGRRAGDAMDASATQREYFARTNDADANGEVVWS